MLHTRWPLSSHISEFDSTVFEKRINKLSANKTNVTMLYIMTDGDNASLSTSSLTMSRSTTYLKRLSRLPDLLSIVPTAHILPEIESSAMIIFKI